MIQERIRQIFAETAAAHDATAQQATRAISDAVDAMRSALERGGKIIVFGNGGSAADSQHFTAELVGRFRLNRQPLAALALTTDTSILTSIANDFSYDLVFARQLQALGKPGDVALAISTSGRSPNVLAGLAEATRRGLTTVALVGSRTDVITADITISVPTEHTARIQEVHRTILHVICELIEDAFASGEAPQR